MSDTDYSTVKVMVIDNEAFARKFVTRLLEAIGQSHLDQVAHRIQTLMSAMGRYR